MNRTVEQIRAKYSLDKINGQIQGKATREDYARHIKKLPATILNNGLGQAMAFLRSHNKPGTETLYKDLQEWVCGEESGEYPRRIYRDTSLLESLMTKDRTQYIQAQGEILSLLTWMKKFADAFLPDEKEEGNV